MATKERPISFVAMKGREAPRCGGAVTAARATCDPLGARRNLKLGAGASCGLKAQFVVALRDRRSRHHRRYDETRIAVLFDLEPPVNQIA
jgi:hypothetical protein